MKKIMCLLLILVMVLGLAACGGGSATTTTPDVLTSDTDNTTTPGDTTTEEPSVEELGEWEGDYETATIQDVMKYGVGSTRWDGSLPLVTDGYKLNLGFKTDYRSPTWTITS